MPVYSESYARGVKYWLHRERAGELELIDRYAQLMGGPILELASGAARVTKELARRGHTVVGLERSDVMLAKAREVVGRMPEKVHRRIHLVKGDMRHFAFARPFPLICIPFYSFWYNLDENGADACVQSMTENLSPGGMFLVEGEWGPASVHYCEEHGEFWKKAAGTYGFSFRYEPYLVENDGDAEKSSFIVGVKR